jgi:hypothetical protein
VISTCSQHWRNFGLQMLQKQWRSEGCHQGVVKWTGGRGLWWRHTKTHHMLWQVPEC